MTEPRHAGLHRSEARGAADLRHRFSSGTNDGARAVERSIRSDSHNHPRGVRIRAVISVASPMLERKSFFNT
jgi:hypothetical protein